MSSDSEKALLIAVVRQLGTIKLDFDAIAKEIGTPTSKAAYMQWTRFQKKLHLATGLNATMPTGNSKEAKSTAKLPATPSNKVKKRKIEKGKAEDDEDGVEDDQEEVTPVKTVSRKIPGRKVRVLSLKEMEISAGNEDRSASGQEAV